MTACLNFTLLVNGVFFRDYGTDVFMSNEKVLVDQLTGKWFLRDYGTDVFMSNEKILVDQSTGKWFSCI